MRPTFLRSLMPLIPETIVPKIMKGMKILMASTKRSPRNFIRTAVAGANCPSSTAATRAMNTSRVRWRERNPVNRRIQLRYRNARIFVLVLVFILILILVFILVFVLLVVVVIAVVVVANVG